MNNFNRKYNKSLNYTIIWLLIIFCLSFSANAQSAQHAVDENNTLHNDYKYSSIIVATATGYGSYRDLGTAPISFNGMMLQPTVELEFGGNRSWIKTLSVNTSIGIFEDTPPPRLNFDAYDVCNTIQFKARKPLGVFQPAGGNRGLHLDANSTDKLAEGIPVGELSFGIGVENFLDVTVNPAYENAAAGISEFLGPLLFLRADVYLWSLFKHNPKRFPKQMHIELGTMPVAAVLRPGYAYIDNYTAAQPVLNALFDNFEWLAKPFAEIYSNIGFDIITGVGNRISISYLWTYLSSGNSDIWRFDHASHLLQVAFMVSLKKRKTL